MEVDRDDWLMPRLRCAVNELMFVLITDMLKLLFKAELIRHCCQSQRQSKKLTAMTGAPELTLAGRRALLSVKLSESFLR